MKTKGLIVFCLVVFALPPAQAQDSTAKAKKEPRLVFKTFPVDYVLSQMPQYFSEIRFDLECAVAPRHTVQIGISGIMPGLFNAPIQAFGAISEYADSPYFFWGGKGILAYRYYFGKEKINFKGGYVGAEITAAGFLTYRRVEGREPGFYSNSTSSRTHGIMTNYNFTVGYHNVISKRRRNGHIRETSIDIGLSVGYRYHYFWRQYEQGNMEYEKNLLRGQSLQDNLYAYYKKVPVGGSLHISFGRFF